MQILHKLAARAFIREYEQGMFDKNETEHEVRSQENKNTVTLYLLSILIMTATYKIAMILLWN